MAAALLLVRLADEWVSFLPTGIVEQLHAQLDLSYSQVGALLVAMSAGGILGIPISVAADHVSRRAMASLGALGYSACLLTFGFGRSFPVLLVAGFLLGVSSDAMIRGCEVALVDLAGDDLRSALAGVNAFGAIGDVLGPLTLAAAAALGIGWRPVFIGASGLLAAYGVLLASQPLPRPRGDRPRPLAGVREVARDRRALRLMLAGTLFGLLDEPFLAFTIAMFQRDQGRSQAAATLIAGSALVGGLIGFSVVAMSRSGRASKTALGRSAIGVLVSMVALLLVPVWPVQVAAALAFGIAGGVFWVTVQGTILAARPGLAGTTVAVWSTLEVVAGAFPLAVGAVADARGLTAGLWMYAAVAFALIALAAGTVTTTSGFRSD